MTSYTLTEKDGERFFVVKNPIFTLGSDATADEADSRLVDPLALQFQMGKSTITIVKLGSQELCINGVALDAARLKEGDLISYGDAAYQFSLASPAIVASDKKSLRSTSSIEMVNTVAALIEGVLQQNNLALTMPKLLSLACDFISADHGTLFIDGEDQANQFNYPEGSALSISSSAIQKAQESGTSIVWSLDSTMDESDLSQSIVTHGLTSILVSPFSVQDKLNGYLYVQREARKESFSESEVALFDIFTRMVVTLLTELFVKNEQQETIEQLKGIERKGDIIYASEVMKRLLSMAEKVANKPVPVLINGETGTGKEVLARFIHDNSQMKDQKFIAVNCGAIPPNLIESELFGHVKGSFTGAIEDKKGIFEECDSGTLFLDEIGELDLNVQVTLLRVLQEKKVTPVGSSKEIPVSFRLLSATHVDLEKAISENRFREDLYFRINVMQLTLPPLRERGQDILLIAQHLIEKYQIEYGMQGVRLSKNGEKSLMKHRWTGNVRELQNRVQKALIQCDGTTIQEEDLGLTVTERHERMTLKEARESAERQVVEMALKEAKGNLTLAGSILGVDRKVLRDVMTRLELDKSQFK
ncbi:MAG: sigma-54 dependent transcriptional regulator [Fibrobacterales bacterium]